MTTNTSSTNDPTNAGSATSPRSRRRLFTGIAALFAALTVLLGGCVIAPRPPSLSSEEHGDSDILQAARPELTGIRDQVSIAVIDGEDISFASFGATPDTRFEIGSITKVFTAQLLLDAIERGEVTLETSLGETLDLGDVPAASVSMEQLATHHSGLPRLHLSVTGLAETFVIATLLAGDPYTEDIPILIEKARQTTPNPEQGYEYSNFGVALLGQSLAAAADVPYAELLSDRVLQPLGLNNTILPETAQNLPSDQMTGYTESGRSSANWTLNASSPAGGIMSDAHDMATFAQAYTTGQWRDSVAPEPLERTDEGEIGLLWHIDTNPVREDQTLTWHNGGTGGFRSYLGIDRERQRAVVVLSNTAVTVNPVGQRLLANDALFNDQPHDADDAVDGSDSAEYSPSTETA